MRKLLPEQVGKAGGGNRAGSCKFQLTRRIGDHCPGVEQAICIRMAPGADGRYSGLMGQLIEAAFYIGAVGYIFVVAVAQGPAQREIVGQSQKGHRATTGQGQELSGIESDDRGGRRMCLPPGSDRERAEYRIEVRPWPIVLMREFIMYLDWDGLPVWADFSELELCEHAGSANFRHRRQIGEPGRGWESGVYEYCKCWVGPVGQCRNNKVIWQKGWGRIKRYRQKV